MGATGRTNLHRKHLEDAVKWRWSSLLVLWYNILHWSSKIKISKASTILVAENAQCTQKMVTWRCKGYTADASPFRICLNGKSLKTLRPVF